MKTIIAFSLLFLLSVYGQEEWLERDSVKKPLKEKISKVGVTGPIYVRDAFSEINGGTFNISRIALRTTTCNPPVQVVAAFKNTAMFAFFYLDFGVGASIIHLRYSNGAIISAYPFNAKIFIDFENGEKIADFNVHNTGGTGGWCAFKDLNVYLKRRITGIHHVYFVASCDPDPRVGTFNLQTLRFSNTNEGVCSL